MIKLALGFPGEKFVYLPVSMLESMDNNPLTSDLYVHSLGYFAHAAYHYFNRSHGCKQFIFIYCKEGEGWIILNNKKYILSPDEFMILPPDIPHTYGASANDPWSIYWVHFAGAKADLLANGHFQPTKINKSKHLIIEDSLRLFDEIYTSLRTAITLAACSYANICFAHFLARFTFSEQVQQATVSSEYSDSIINRAIYYMTDNIHKQITVEEIANYLGYSTAYFHRKFSKITGCAPINYFIRLKLNQACSDLIKTDLKIIQIAHNLGFKDNYYFSRIFTQVIGISPLKFRKENLKIESQHI